MTDEEFDNYEMTPEEEEEEIARHVAKCKLHLQDVYCKICNEM